MAAAAATVALGLMSAANGGRRRSLSAGKPARWFVIVMLLAAVLSPGEADGGGAGKATTVPLPAIAHTFAFAAHGSESTLRRGQEMTTSAGMTAAATTTTKMRAMARLTASSEQSGASGLGGGGGALRGRGHGPSVSSGRVKCRDDTDVDGHDYDDEDDDDDDAYFGFTCCGAPASSPGLSQYLRGGGGSAAAATTLPQNRGAIAPEYDAILKSGKAINPDMAVGSIDTDDLSSQLPWPEGSGNKKGMFEEYQKQYKTIKEDLRVRGTPNPSSKGTSLLRPIPSFRAVAACRESTHAMYIYIL
jgi:hypothetical protein